MSVLLVIGTLPESVVRAVSSDLAIDLARPITALHLYHRCGPSEIPQLHEYLNALGGDWAHHPVPALAGAEPYREHFVRALSQILQGLGVNAQQLRETVAVLAERDVFRRVPAIEYLIPPGTIRCVAERLQNGGWDIEVSHPPRGHQRQGVPA